MPLNEPDADGCAMLGRMFVAAMAVLALVGCAASAGRVGMVSGGEPRSYKLVAVPGRDSTPRPLVIALHGWLGTPEQMASMSGLSAAAARLGFAVVYPEGDWRSWGIDQSSPRGATDAGFLADVVADVSARIPVDPARITAVGFSNGGFMAQALACSGRVRLAGVAVIASGLAASAAASCRPGAAVPFLLIEGTDDPVVPVNGTGTGEERILPANETLAFWATENRCNGFDLAGAEFQRTGRCHPARDRPPVPGRRHRGLVRPGSRTRLARQRCRLPGVPRRPADVGDRRDIRRPRLPAPSGSRATATDRRPIGRCRRQREPCLDAPEVLSNRTATCQSPRTAGCVRGPGGSHRSNQNGRAGHVPYDRKS